MSPNTTPMLPSVSAQNPVVTGASAGASVAVSLMAIVDRERSVGCFDPGYRRFARACQPVDYSTAGRAALSRNMRPVAPKKVK
jgi:hypothetical protein